MVGLIRNRFCDRKVVLERHIPVTERFMEGSEVRP
jgi:hypothetical protein